jgi:hypothetical protein
MADKASRLKQQKKAVADEYNRVMTTNQENLKKFEEIRLTYPIQQRALKAPRIANARLVKDEATGLMTVALDNGKNVVVSDLFLNGPKLSEAGRKLIQPGAFVLTRTVESAAPATWSSTSKGVQVKNSWDQIYAVMPVDQADHWREEGIL